MKFRFESKDMTLVGGERIHFRLLERVVRKKPQVPNTARQAASLPGDISRGKRSSMPQPKKRPDSPVPSLQGMARCPWVVSWRTRDDRLHSRLPDHLWLWASPLCLQGQAWQPFPARSRILVLLLWPCRIEGGNLTSAVQQKYSVSHMCHVRCPCSHTKIVKRKWN